MPKFRVDFEIHGTKYITVEMEASTKREAEEMICEEMVGEEMGIEVISDYFEVSETEILNFRKVKDV